MKIIEVKNCFNTNGELTIEKIKNLETVDSKYFEVPIFKLKIPVISGANKKLKEFSTVEDEPLVEENKIPTTQIFDYVTRDLPLSVERLANANDETEEPPSKTVEYEPTPGPSGLQKFKRSDKRKRSLTPTHGSDSHDDDVDDNYRPESAAKKSKPDTKVQPKTKRAGKKEKKTTSVPPAKHQPRDDDDDQDNDGKKEKNKTIQKSATPVKRQTRATTKKTKSTTTTVAVEPPTKRGRGNDKQKKPTLSNPKIDGSTTKKSIIKISNNQKK